MESLFKEYWSSEYSSIEMVWVGLPDVGWVWAEGGFNELRVLEFRVKADGGDSSAFVDSKHLHRRGWVTIFFLPKR